MSAIHKRLQQLVADGNTEEADKLFNSQISCLLLQQLISAGHTDAAKYAIKAKFTSVRMNRDALETAIVQDNNKVLACLLKNCDVSSMDRNTTLVNLAVQRNNVDGARLLLACIRLRPDSVTNILDTAADENHPGIIELFLKYAEDINATADIGPALVSVAQVSNSLRTPILRTLLSGRNTTFEEHKYVTAMDYTIRNKNTEQLKIMLDARPNVDLYVNSNNLLERAVTNASTEIVSILMADPRIDPSRRVNDRSALDAALVGGNDAFAISVFKHPKVDPSADSHQMFIRAIRANLIGLVEHFLKDPRVTLNNNIIRDASSKPGMWKLISKDPRVNLCDPELLAMFTPPEIIEALSAKHKRELEVLQTENAWLQAENAAYKRGIEALIN